MFIVLKNHFHCTLSLLKGGESLLFTYLGSSKRNDRNTCTDVEEINVCDLNDQEKILQSLDHIILLIEKNEFILMQAKSKCACFKLQ